jgi:trehalose/maltose hydrolase-like predicted phosphorylase
MARVLKAMGERGYTASVFTLAYDGFAPEDEGVREALTSTGNGYFRVRGEDVRIVGEFRAAIHPDVVVRLTIL